jgi:flagellar hook-length control protein FliK
MAQMINKASQSEMRIGINTSAFGNVEVRTVVHANDVGVLIGSEKGDLRSFLANELPAIANTLQQQNLRLNQVNFHQQGFGFSNQMSSGGDPQPRSFVPRSHVAGAMPSAPLLVEFKEPTELPSIGHVGGLSILA